MKTIYVTMGKRSKIQTRRSSNCRACLDFYLLWDLREILNINQYIEKDARVILTRVL